MYLRGSRRVTEKTCDTERTPYPSDMVAEPGCDMPWRAPQEQISERICDQIMDVCGPQVVEQTIGVPKISILQGTAEQILDVLVPETVEQLVKLPKTVSEDGIKQRTVEGIADIPVPQVVKELVKVSKVFSQDRVEQRYGGQITKTPGVSLAEKIVKIPVFQHEVLENPDDACKMTRAAFKGAITQFIEKAVDVPVVAQRQIRMNRKVQKTMVIHQLLYTDDVVGVLLCRSCKLHWCAS